MANNTVDYSGANGYVNSSGTYVPSTGASAPTPISVDRVGTSVSPLTVPQTTPTTTTTPTVPAPTGTTTDSNGKATIPQPTPAATDTGTQGWIKSQLSNLYSKLSTKSDVQTQLQNDNGLAQKTTDSTGAYNTYNQARLELQQKLANIQDKNPTGATAAGKSEEYALAERQGNANLANLAVIAQSAQGNLEAAQKIISDKLDAQFKPISDQIDFLSKFSQVNANDLTDSERVQLQSKLDAKKTDLTSVNGTADELHKNMLQNNAPASSYAAMDKITNDFVSGKITAQQAQTQMYQAAGSYGIDPYKNAQLANVVADTKKKLTEAANGSGDSVQSLGQQLVQGLLDPSQLSKRTANYNAVLKAANDYSLATTGKPYDVAKANRDFKFATNIQTQNTLNYLGSLVGGNGQTGNLDELLNLSNSINRTSFPALNAVENWSKLESGDPAIASYHAVVTEVADQVAKILQGGGTGSGTSDAKLNQALSMFQSSFTKEQLASVVSSIKPLLMNRAKSMVGDNPYLSDYADQFGIKKTESKTQSPVISSANTKINGLVVTLPNGQTWNAPNIDALNLFKKDNGLK